MRKIKAFPPTLEHTSKPNTLPLDQLSEITKFA